jgi:hypothetical protein
MQSNFLQIVVFILNYGIKMFNYEEDDHLFNTHEEEFDKQGEDKRLPFIV